MLSRLNILIKPSEFCWKCQTSQHEKNYKFCLPIFKLTFIHVWGHSGPWLLVSGPLGLLTSSFAFRPFDPHNGDHNLLFHLHVIHVTLMYVSMMHVSMMHISDLDACIQDACIHDACIHIMHVSMIHRIHDDACIYMILDPDVTAHDAWTFNACMHDAGTHDADVQVCMFENTLLENILSKNTLSENTLKENTLSDKGTHPQKKNVFKQALSR